MFHFSQPHVSLALTKQTCMGLNKPGDVGEVLVCLFVFGSQYFFFTKIILAYTCTRIRSSHGLNLLGNGTARKYNNITLTKSVSYLYMQILHRSMI
jgi:hypothetical protein